MSTQRSEAARTLGLIGGAVKSERKARAARKNWKKALAKIQANRHDRHETLANNGSNEATKNA